MLRLSLAFCVLVLNITSVFANGILIPSDKSLKPIAMVSHKVTVDIEDQVSLTTVEQVFRNHTNRPLEAIYLFPVPKGANVNKFTMWVNGKEQNAEILKAKEATDTYNAIVRRTLDPGLLEYIGNDLLRLKIFPIEPNIDQKVRISYRSIAPKDMGVVEYIYPIKSQGVLETLEGFSITANIKSQTPIQHIYSPSHAIDIKRHNEKQVSISFNQKQAMVDKDFQLFYSSGSAEIAITPLFHRPVGGEEGYYMFLISPPMEKIDTKGIPQDLTLVLDISGSMTEVKMNQAKQALKYCLSQLTDADRFAIIAFSTSVRNYREELVGANKDQIENASRWVDNLKAGGGTAIQLALDRALEMRTKDLTRPFTMVFFTDGQPTVGEVNPERIVKNFIAKNSENTRMFTFGVGDDVNAVLLDGLAEQTRGVSTYVREAEDIKTKMVSLHSKLVRPALTTIKLGMGSKIESNEMYPPQIPDLFFGNQVVVIGKYKGEGPTDINLRGQYGKEEKTFTFPVLFPSKTEGDHEFVEELWARRKVGFLLDQIRRNGEQKELLTELLALAKKHGIATPYTSHLIVPDGVAAVVNRGVGSPRDSRLDQPFAGPAPLGGLNGPGGMGMMGGNGIAGNTGIGGMAGFGGGMMGMSGGFGGGMAGGRGGVNPGIARDPKDGKDPSMIPTVPTKPMAPVPLEQLAKDFSKSNQKLDKLKENIEQNNLAILDDQLKQRVQELEKNPKAKKEDIKKAKDELNQLQDLRTQQANSIRARELLNKGQQKQTQVGAVGVDLAIVSNNLRSQDRLTQNANRIVNGRNCLQVNGVWIDQDFDGNKMKMVSVKAQSDAYFAILAKQPKMKDVFRLGNQIIFVTPSGTALIVDTVGGKEKLEDKEIDAMFQAKK